VQFNKCNWGSFVPIHATDPTTTVISIGFNNSLI